MGKKAALWGERGRDGREDGCAQPITEHVTLTDPSAGKCLYPGISMNFVYCLVSQHDVFPHLRDEAPQGKIWNFITMHNPLGPALSHSTALPCLGQQPRKDDPVQTPQGLFSKSFRSEGKRECGMDFHWSSPASRGSSSAALG